MGLFDGWINSLLFATGLKKKIPKIYYDTDEEKFLKEIPTGQAFVFLTSMRKLDPFKGGFNLPDFMRGGIQGASESYWIHAGIGFKEDFGEVRIIESLDKITLRTINAYFEPVNQLKLFFPPISKLQSLNVWKKALTVEGNNYDYGEIFDHISVTGRLFNFRWGSQKLFVCGSFARWAFDPIYKIMKPKIPAQRGKPSDINACLQKDLKTEILVYNMDARQYN